MIEVLDEIAGDITKYWEKKYMLMKEKTHSLNEVAQAVHIIVNVAQKCLKLGYSDDEYVNLSNSNR